ncbi:MAG: rhomboid family intramembrane serine protease [Bacteroidota bacterium]
MQNAYSPPTGFSVMPPVVKNLLIINVLAYFATFGFSGFTGRPDATPLGEMVTLLFALWPAGVPSPVIDAIAQQGLDVGTFYPWQLVTTGFLHGGFSHILFNLLFGVWMFGMRIENTLGSRRFAVFYLICVIGASLTQLAVTSAPYFFGGAPYPIPGPTVGASGGVFGILIAFGMLYPDEPIYLYFFVPIKAKWLVLGLIVFNLYAGTTGTQAGVANFAHLGGALTGFLLIQFWRGKLPLRPKPQSVT